MGLWVGLVMNRAMQLTRKVLHDQHKQNTIPINVCGTVLPVRQDTSQQQYGFYGWDEGAWKISQSKGLLQGPWLDFTGRPQLRKMAILNQRHVSILLFTLATFASGQSRHGKGVLLYSAESIAVRASKQRIIHEPARRLTT